VALTQVPLNIIKMNTTLRKFKDSLEDDSKGGGDAKFLLKI
jgi:hypothetical protein